MTGAWVPRKGPSSALFLITDTRPLILRAVGSCNNYFWRDSDYYLVISGSLRSELFVVHDPSGSHIASFIWCARGSCASSAQLTFVSDLDYSLIYYFALWLTLVVLSTVFTFIHGLDYVAWPRLISLTETIHYNGAGFRSGRHGTGFGLDFGKLRSEANAQW